MLPMVVANEIHIFSTFNLYSNLISFNWNVFPAANEALQLLQLQFNYYFVVLCFKLMIFQRLDYILPTEFRLKLF